MRATQHTFFPRDCLVPRPPFSRGASRGFSRAVNRSINRFWLCSATALASLPCMAQSSSTEETTRDVTLAPITVRSDQDTATSPVDGVVASISRTATKTDTPIEAIPQSISVVTRDEMDQQNVHSVGDSLRYTPGVFADSRLGGVLDSVFLRGFGGFATAATSPQLLDGLPLPMGNAWAVSTIDPSVLDRVEVLRGPASVLYGQASPGGTINLESKLPSTEPYHNITVEGGDRRHAQASFDFSGPVTDDHRVTYRLNGLVTRQDEQIDYSKQQRIVLAPTLQWKPNDQTRITVYAFYQNDPNNHYAGWLPATGTLWNSDAGKISTHFFSGDPDYDNYSRRQYMLGFAAEHRFNDTWRVRQNVRLTHIEADFKGVAVDFTNPFDGVPGDLNRYASWSREQLNNVALDNQAEARFKTGALSHTLLFGLAWTHTNTDTVNSAYGLASAINYLMPRYNLRFTDPGVQLDTRQDQDQLGIYVQDQIRFGRWSFLLGLRQDRSHTDTHDRLTGVSDNRLDHATTGRVGAVYRFDNGFLPYASYSTSFQPTSGTDYSGTTFKPVKARQTEIGMRYQPADHNASITLAGFDIEERNVATTDPDHPLYDIQTGKVRSRGLELEARASLSQRIDAIVAYTWLDTTLRKSGDPTLVGNRLPAVPRQMASLWLNYAVVPGAKIAAGVRHIGRSAGDDANTFDVPSVTLVDLAASVDLGQWYPSMKGWKSAVHINNLFDRTYVASCFSENGCFYGRRRAIVANLSYQW